MPGRFTGWQEQAFDVLLELDGDPSVEVRDGLRRDRERMIRQPMIALLQDVADAAAAYEDFSVWSFARWCGSGSTRAPSCGSRRGSTSP
jgi:hypothetical protein